MRIIAEAHDFLFSGFKVSPKKVFSLAETNIILIYISKSNSRENSYEVKSIKGIFIPQGGHFISTLLDYVRNP